MSIVRPSPAQKTRRLIVLVLTVFAIVVAYAQMAMDWGQTPQEFSADSDATLRVAGFAFSIWGLIYLGLVAYAVRQVLPQTGESELIQALGWPSAAALLGIGLWILAAAFDWEAATIVLIFGSAIILTGALMARGGTIRALALGDRDRWLTVWPLALLAGWLTIAAPVNLLTVLTGNGALPPAMSPTAWALVAVVGVVVVALAVTWRIRVIAFALPVTWGLIGVFAAEQDRNPTLAFAALAAALITLGVAGVMVFRLHARRVVERAG